LGRQFIMYRPELVHAYKLSRSKLPIESWIQVVGKNLPQFSSASAIYNPIGIQIKMAGELNSPTGSVKMSVDATDPNWYPKLVGVLETMTKKKGLSVVNYLGNSIESLSPSALSNVGECDLMQKTQTIRLAEPVQPPMYMSHNKLEHLKKWWDEKRNGLAQKIAVELKGLNMSEIANATKLGGPVQTTICNYLERNTLDNLSWSEFSKTYGNGTLNVSEISKKLLDAVRTGLVANEKQIRTYHANVGSEAALWKDTASVGVTKYKDDHVMFQDILEDVMHHPLVGQEMVQGILYGIKSRATVATTRKIASRVPSSSSIRHPIQSYYQDYHYNVHGKLPGHVMSKYNKNAGLIASNYPGDRKKAFDMFNLFSGRTIDCGCGSGKKKKKQEKKEELKAKISPVGGEMPKLIPIGSNLGGGEERQMPKLIPIGNLIERDDAIGTQMPKLIPIGSNLGMGKEDRQMPKLIPIGKNDAIGTQMPKLIPIGSNLGMGGEKQMPKLIPIGNLIERDDAIGTQMPKLIPIGSNLGGGGERQMPKLIPIGKSDAIGTQMPKLIPIGGLIQKEDGTRMPKLIPINARPVERASDANLSEPIWVDDAPNLMDFLQRKK